MSGTRRARLAAWMVAHRRWCLLAFALVTLFFALGLPRVQLKTVFSDLLPRDDPFVQVFKDHPNFGNPLTLMLMVQHRHGSIYNAETIDLVWQLTRDIDLAPAVDHAQVISITTEKARYSEATPYGVDMRPLMNDTPPRTAQEIAQFRARVDKSPNTKTFLISRDETATLVMATFIEHQLDYAETFEYVQGLVEAARSDQHAVYLTGQPALVGWVYRHQVELMWIFALTIGVLILALAVYLRSAVGVIIPTVTSATAAIWGFGFVGWLDIEVEPLLMVVPLLLVARSFSHSVQFIERYSELLAEQGDRELAAAETMARMAKPSVLSILTDAMGIAVVIAAPIPAMVRHAIFCGVWALWLIPTGVGLITLLLASTPAPARRQSAGPGLHRHWLDAFLQLAARASQRPRVYATATVIVVVALLIGWQASMIRIGNPMEGSSLLWADSEFNTAVRAINDHFPGTNTLEIVLEAKDAETSNWTSQQQATVETMQALQRALESAPAPPRATLSFADYLTEVNRLFSGGHPKWLPLDPRQSAVSAATMGAMMGASSTAYSHVVSENLQHATVSMWYPDNTQSTVDAALATARQAVAQVGVDHPGFRVRLGTGVIALQEAVNRVIERYHHIVVGLLNLFILLVFSLAYRSLVAGLILLVPVNLAHLAMIATMHWLGVGLDVNSMIVAAIGLGVGIDYGIYLLSRICEEAGQRNGQWDAAMHAALVTTGHAIAFTALIMAVAILPLYWLSGLRFVADMGLLIICIMAINMVTALFVLPTLVNLIRPKFVLNK